MGRKPSDTSTVWLSFYLVLSSALTGCERPPAPGESGSRVENPHIVFVGLPDGDPRWDAVESGARRLIKNYDTIRFTVLRPLDDSPAALDGACRNAVHQAAHAVIVWIQHPEHGEKAVSTIVASGASAITIGPQLRSEAMYAHVQCSPLDAAQILGERLRSLAGESLSYSLLHDNGRSSFDTDVYRRFDAGASGAFGLRKLTEAYVGGGRARAEEALAEVLGKFPNVGLIVSLDPQLWFGDPEGRRLNASNRFVTVAAPPVLWPAVRSGRAAALVGWIDGDIGRAAVDFAVRSLGERRTGRLLEIPPELVTHENLDDFIRRYQAAIGRMIRTSPAASASAPSSAPRP